MQPPDEPRTTGHGPNDRPANNPSPGPRPRSNEASEHGAAKATASGAATVVVAEGLGFAYDDRPDPVFEGVDLRVHAGQRCGVIGANGSGKSTLLKLVAGRLTPTAGALRATPSLTFVGQHDRLGPSVPRGSAEGAGATPAGDAGSLDGAAAPADVRSALLASVPVAGTLADEIARAEADGLPDPLRYADAIAAYGAAGGFEIEARLDALAARIGVDERLLKRAPRTLSGGERRLLRLLAAFLLDVELVLLDEPTNHLDETAKERLVALLEGSNAAVLMVSHDRWFLDRATGTTMVVQRGGLTTYSGNYDRYRAAQEADRRWRERERGRLEGEIGKLQRAERSYKVWGARKESEKASHLDKGYIGARAARIMKRGILAKERITARREELEAKRPFIDKRYRVGFEPTGAPQGRCLQLADLSVQAGDRMLLEHVTLGVAWGERVAIVGANGVGKSSLLRALSTGGGAGGAVTWSNRAEVGYLPQVRSLDARKDLSSLFADPADAPEARRLLGAFGVPGHLFDAPLSELSLGQLRKAELVLLMLAKPNVLLLDEPTTHLDLPGIEMLEAALVDFDGVVLLVSHDRALREATTTRTLRLEGGRLLDDDGGAG